MTWTVFLDEFASDWKLLGRSHKTINEYLRLLRELASDGPTEPSLSLVKAWLATSKSKEHARYRARAVRAFGKWAEGNDVTGWEWWSQVPLAQVPIKPQPTVTAGEYEELYRRLDRLEDKLLVELLWSTGLRVSELARLRRADVNLAEQFVIVRESKTGRPRLAPLSDRACRLIRRWPSTRDHLLSWSTQTIQRRLERLGAPTAHAFRRGWAVDSLERGVSQTSVQTAAGWRSGAMVTRYVSSVSATLALREFKRVTHR